MRYARDVYEGQEQGRDGQDLLDTESSHNGPWSNSTSTSSSSSSDGSSSSDSSEETTTTTFFTSTSSESDSDSDSEESDDDLADVVSIKAAPRETNSLKGFYL